MPTTATISSNYAGKYAGEIIGKGFAGGETLTKNLITVMPDVDFQVSLRKISYADGRVDYTCGFTPQGTVVLSEVLLTPKKIKNELEICKEDLRQLWSSATMGFSGHNDKMPKDVQTALISEVISSTGVEVNSDIWNGVTGTTGEFDGFLTKWAADASIIKVGAGITAITAATISTNVVAHLQVAIDSMTLLMRRKKDLVLAVSSNVYQAYASLNQNAAITNGQGGGELDYKFGKYTLEEITDLPDDTIAIYAKKNLVFATGLMADHNSVRVQDMDDSDLSGNVRFKMVYTAAVGYVEASEIVWLLTTAV